LVSRLADGDRSAVPTTFEVMWPVLRAYSARALTNAADAEDAAQQALVKFFDQVADFDGRRDPLAWALTIAAFECRTHRRRLERRKERDLSGAHEALASCGTPEDALIEKDLESAAREVLGTLSEPDVRTILAAMEEERDERQKGATFRKRLQRALSRLRLAWRTKHESG
jgi:RNA polymerase sigma-70 factor (ECF subfamily)